MIKSYIRAFVIFVFAAFLSACASPLLNMLPGGAGQSINDATVTATAQAVRTECLRAPMARMGYRDAVNKKLEEMGVMNRALALDCNGDGQPDF